MRIVTAWAVALLLGAGLLGMGGAVGEEEGQASVYLVNADGKVWKDGKRDDGAGSSLKIEALGVTGSAQIRGLFVLSRTGSVYNSKGLTGYSVPIVPIKAAAITAAGLEPYVLEATKGQVWRYYREGPGKGDMKRDEAGSLSLPQAVVDFAVKGPPADKAERTVYILLANSKVFANNKQQPDLSPTVGLNKPTAIAVDGDDVYLLDGANGKVYKNGKHAAELSPSVFIPCVDLAVCKGKAYVLTPDGAVYVNGKKDDNVSSDVKSKFVGLYVGPTGK